MQEATVSLCHCVTVSHVNVEEESSLTGQSITPNRVKPYI